MNGFLRKGWVAVAGFAATAGISGGYLSYRRAPAPDQALRVFYAQPAQAMVAEDQLMDPLILAGAPAVPRIAEEVRYRKMPLRRYAVGALGNIGSPSAIPVLVELIRDDSEDPLVRGDALEALWLLGWSARVEETRGLAGRTDYLGATGRRLLGGEQPSRRSRLAAWLGTHN